MDIKPVDVTDTMGKIEEHSFQDWTVRCRSSHILPSKCSDDCKSGLECCFCRYNNELNLTHLPEMVFPNNILQLKHKSGCAIEFNAFDALKLVKQENLSSVKIACAESWKRAREDTGLVEKTVGEFDWTFQTDYHGTYKNWNIEETNVGIDMDRLKQKEQILLYRNLTLFEDELHDNGISVCSVRIRVMPSGFFILLRYFLRVDGVIILTNDSRIYHDFSTDYIINETSTRENKVSELRVPLCIMNEPDEITPLLTLKCIKYEKLCFPSICK